MIKQYVIVNMKGEYCQLLYNGLVYFTSIIQQAQFFDTETLAYKFIDKNRTMFSKGSKDEFFEIRCIVVIFKDEL